MNDGKILRVVWVQVKFTAVVHSRRRCCPQMVPFGDGAAFHSYTCLVLCIAHSIGCQSVVSVAHRHVMMMLCIGYICAASRRLAVCHQLLSLLLSTAQYS